jgi:alpha-beta hydrolase superfamily lysophospholipase
MRETTFSFRADDGADLFARRFRPNDGVPVRGAIHILHGMAEHGGRYAHFAERLTERGYVVYANDHRGHGRTAAKPDDLGHHASAMGLARLSHDVRQLIVFDKGETDGVPLTLFGHSMGTLLAEQVMVTSSRWLAGVILSAPIGMPDRLSGLGRLVARVERARGGPRGRSGLLFSMTFGAYNRAFAPTRTSFDWISRDTAEVDAYVADPLCGFGLTNSFWVHFLDALADTGRASSLRRVTKDLPVLVLAGSEDPVNRQAQGAHELCAAYRRAGLTRVAEKLYPGARHSLLKEVNRDEVISDLVAWIEAERPAPSQRHLLVADVPRR